MFHFHLTCYRRLPRRPERSPAGGQNGLADDDSGTRKNDFDEVLHNHKQEGENKGHKELERMTEAIEMVSLPSSSSRLAFADFF